MKKTIFIILLLALVLKANSQRYKNYNVNTFLHGWYIGANCGLSLYIAEGNNFINRKDFATFSLIENGGFMGRVELGYDFTDVLGVRGFLGRYDHTWPDPGYRNTDGSYRIVSFASEDLTVDLMLNLSNWWGGSNPQRLVNVSAFGGIGLAHRDKANFQSDIITGILRGGLQATYNYTQDVNFNLIVDGNFVSDNFNGYSITSPVDFYPAFSVGIIYHLPSRYRYRYR
jgi:hypothetical protein